MICRVGFFQSKLPSVLIHHHGFVVAIIIIVIANQTPRFIGILIITIIIFKKNNYSRSLISTGRSEDGSHDTVVQHIRLHYVVPVLHSLLKFNMTTQVVIHN